MRTTVSRKLDSQPAVGSGGCGSRAVTHRTSGGSSRVVKDLWRKGGQRAYDLARQGKAVKLEPRAVTIHPFEITGIELPKVHFKVVCSTGTYIRSLANDFGAALGTGGYLS